MPRSMTRRTKTSAALAAALAALALSALAGAGAQASPVATASKTCSLSTQEQRHLGASYVTSLKVVGTTCSKGKTVVEDFHACRKDNGGKNGKCTSKVDGYSCEEHRYDAVPDVQYNSRVKCERGDKVVRHTYTQNL
jgi:hypothetical protein